MLFSLFLSCMPFKTPNKHNPCFAVSYHQWLLWPYLPSYFRKSMYVSSLWLPCLLPLLWSSCYYLDYKQVNYFCSWISFGMDFFPQTSLQLLLIITAATYQGWSGTEQAATQLPESPRSQSGTVSSGVLLKKHCFPGRCGGCFLPYP